MTAVPRAARATIALVWVVGLVALSYGTGRRVPLLEHIDLGFHELGHLVFYVFPISEFVTAAAGSAFEIGVPVGLGVYFSFVRHERLAASVCWAWAATSARSVAIYIADAPYERLPLIGGEHDWAYLLGPSQLDNLDAAAGLATATKGLGLILALAAAGFALDVLVARRGATSLIVGPDAPPAVAPGLSAPWPEPSSGPPDEPVFGAPAFPAPAGRPTHPVP